MSSLPQNDKSMQHSNSDSDSSNKFSKLERKLRKKEKKLKKKEKKLKKVEKKKLKKEKKEIKKILKKKRLIEKIKQNEVQISTKTDSLDIPISVANIPDLNDVKNEEFKVCKTRSPMTKQEWEAQQSVIKRVLDPETGRHRLIKGSGEVLEECVSRNRHKEINKAATKGDGMFYHSTMLSKITKM